MQSPTTSINKLRNSLTSFYVKGTCSNKTSPIKEDPSILQNLLRMQQKEIDRLEHQNKNLQVLTQNQCSMLYQERTLRTNSTKLQIHADLPQALPNARNARRSTIKSVLQAMKPPPRKIVVSNKLQMNNNECFKLCSILEVNNQQAKQLYQDDSSIQLVKEILKDEDSFIDIITTYPPQQVSIMYDKIKKLINEHEQMFEMILKFKSIIDNSFNLQNIKLQLEALNQLSLQCKNILECKNMKQANPIYNMYIKLNKQLTQKMLNLMKDLKMKISINYQLLPFQIIINVQVLLFAKINQLILIMKMKYQFNIFVDKLNIYQLIRYQIIKLKFSFKNISMLSKVYFYYNQLMIQILNYTFLNKDYAKL
ncbi:unnamed protein product [Paramecium sonneborni]|uniref:Transmembrane protein n=1 Tax=Paramecium sonneborni TaxID=65129 RepID=A0A8S1RJ84_9CILI|nr:unnamed protein product [Paramecium sonneborni]